MKWCRSLRGDMRLLGLVGAGLLVRAAHGAEYNVELEAGVAYSDNLGRLPEGSEREETLKQVGVSQTFEHAGPRLQAVLFSDLQYFDYQKNNFEDQTLGGINVLTNYELVQDYFAWTLIDNWGQQIVDPFRTTGPTNQQDVNYLSTGPQLIAPLGSRNRLTFNSQFSDVHYEESPLDNQRLSKEVGITRDLTDRQSVTLIVRRNEVEFQDSAVGAEDFDNEESFVRYESVTMRGSFMIDAGESGIDVSGAEDDASLFRAEFTRSLRETAEVTVGLGKHFSDAGESFRRVQGAGFNLGRTQDVIATPHPYGTRYVNLGFAVDRPRTTLEAGIVRREEDHSQALEDNRNVSQIYFDIERRISTRWSTSITLEGVRRDYVDIEREDEDATLEFGMSRAFGPRLSVGGRVLYYRRDTTFAVDEAEESRFTIFVNYAPRSGTTN